MSSSRPSTLTDKMGTTLGRAGHVVRAAVRVLVSVSVRLPAAVHIRAVGLMFTQTKNHAGRQQLKGMAVASGWDRPVSTMLHEAHISLMFSDLCTSKIARSKGIKESRRANL